jgi:polygalacturonase
VADASSSTGGTFLTGPIHLRSRVNLEVKEGATIKFLTDPKAYEQYVLTRFEGVELMGLSPLIYASSARDVAITGRGTLDGRRATRLVALERQRALRLEAGRGQPARGPAHGSSRWRSERSRERAPVRRRLVPPAARSSSRTAARTS